MVYLLLYFLFDFNVYEMIVYCLADLLDTCFVCHIFQSF